MEFIAMLFDGPEFVVLLSFFCGYALGFINLIIYLELKKI